MLKEHLDCTDLKRSTVPTAGQNKGSHRYTSDKQKGRTFKLALFTRSSFG